MQGTGFGYAGTRPTGMIGDDVEPSGFERAEDGPIPRRAVHAQMSEVVIIEHQGHQIDLLRRQVRRNGILEGPGESDDRRGRNASLVEPSVAIGQCDWRWPQCGRWRRRDRDRREIWVAVALWHGGVCRRLVGIARPALAINLAGRSD